MNNKIDYKLEKALLMTDAKSSLRFFFVAAAGFKSDQANNIPLNDDGSTIDGVSIYSGPYPGQNGDIYTARGTPDGIKTLAANPHVTSLQGSTQYQPTVPK